MYTTHDKINDRFGFSTGGTFRCAFKNTRIIVIVGISVIALLTVLLIANVIYIVSMFDSTGSIGDFISMDRLFDLTRYSGIASDQLSDSGSITPDQIDEIEEQYAKLLPEGYLQHYYEEKSREAGENDTNYDPTKKHYLLEAFSEEMINMSVSFIATAFGIYALFFAVLAFLITLAVLRTGQTYKFKADDEKFTVIYPKNVGRTLTMEYEYIVGVSDEDWKFLCSPRCLDVTVNTKSGEFTFRVLHTPMSKANGICETPFNIIKEKIGLSNETDVYLVHKTEGRI